MTQDDGSLRFFLGANTPQGFVSRFDQIGDVDGGWRVFALNGGPGTGKSVLLRKLAARAAERGFDTERIHCSSDPDSLDGVIIPELKRAAVDGTPPHAVTPKFPGVYESVVDLAACWDEHQLLPHREEIVALSRSVSRCHEHCCRFLAAAGSLAGDTFRIALDSVNTAKLTGYLDRLGARELRPAGKGPGRERVRFLSAVTNAGVMSFPETAKALAERIYLIHDDHGAVSRLILLAMRTKALAAGYDVVSCYCPLGPFDKLEQLFIPGAGLGFMTSNRFHDFTGAVEPFRIVNSQRFSDREKLARGKKRILFNRKAGAGMLRQAEALLVDAKALHDELETYYIHATDYDLVNELTGKTIERVLR